MRFRRHACSYGGGTGDAGKAIVVGAVRRKGNVVARVIENVPADMLAAFVREAVSHQGQLALYRPMGGYKHLDKEYPHQTIDHAGRIRSRRSAHSND